MDARQQWMAFLIQQGLEYQLISPEDVLRYATPRVIATLPNDLKARVLRAGLNQGVFNPDVVLSVLTPEVLAETVPLATLWACIAEAGAKHFAGEADSVLAEGGGRPSERSSERSGAPRKGAPIAEVHLFENEDPFGDAESMIVIEDDAPDGGGGGDPASPEAGGESAWSGNENTGVDPIKKGDKGDKTEKVDDKAASRSRRVPITRL